MTSLFRFTKTERLHAGKAIDELFKAGTAFNYQNIRTIHLCKSENTLKGVQVLISVPKRKFRNAVDRNHIKRLIREAYRLNKHVLTDELISTISLYIGFIYIGNDVNIAFTDICLSMKNSLEKIYKIYAHKENAHIL